MFARLKHTAIDNLTVTFRFDHREELIDEMDFVMKDVIDRTDDDH